MKKIIVITYLFLFTTLTYSQEFKGGIVLGATTSQVNGDKAGGFHKLGGTLGGFVEKSINNKYTAGFEMLFTQKGSRDNSGSFTINLGYIEVPIIVTYKLNENIGLKAGGAIGINIYETNTVGIFSTKTSNFKGMDFPFILGAEFKVKPKIGLDLRSAFSVVPINYKYTNWCLYATAHVYILK